MSLSRIALRIAAVEALKGRTLVGDRVLESPNGALDIMSDGTLRMDEDRPFVGVYTDDGLASEPIGRNLSDNGWCVLVIEVGIAMAMAEIDPTTGASMIVGVSIPASDRGFEFYLDIVRRQIVNALTDPDSEWADIYRSLHSRVLKVEVETRQTADTGQKLAGQATRITVALTPDPVLGVALPPTAPIMRFLAKLEACEDAVYRAQAATMRTLIGGAEPDWKVHQRRNGLTVDEMRAIGLGPLSQDADRATPPFAGGSVDVEGNGTRELPA